MPRTTIEEVLLCGIGSHEIARWGSAFQAQGLAPLLISRQALVKFVWRSRRPLAVVIAPDDWNHDAYDACRRLRSAPRSRDIPVLMVSRDESPEAALASFAAGADDFLARGEDPRVLAAHVLACVRRYRRRTSAPLLAGPFVVDAGNFSATFKGRPLRLTPAEFGILESLVRRPGSVVRREEGPSHIVETHVCNLRRKLGPDGRRAISTVAGIGYRLDIRP